MNKNKLKTLFNNLKDAFNKNKRKSITILVILILAIISSVTLIAYSFYVNKSTNLIISGIASLDASDVKIDVYRENRDSNGTGIGTYSLSYYVPGETTYTYNSSKTTCDDGITISSFKNSVFAVNATKKGKCKVYFDAIDGYTEDYVVNLFVQQTPGNTDEKNYNQMGKLPKIETGYRYVINNSKTSCNPTATVSISGLNIVIEATQKTTCTVYVDKEVYTAVPTIGTISVSNALVSTSITDELGLMAYGFSDSKTTEPTEWSEIEGVAVDFADAAPGNGTYYLWVKNIAGNAAISSAFTISTLTFAISNVTTNDLNVKALFTAPTGLSSFDVAFHNISSQSAVKYSKTLDAKTHYFNGDMPLYGTYYLKIYNATAQTKMATVTVTSDRAAKISNVAWYGSKTTSDKGLVATFTDSVGLTGYAITDNISSYLNALSNSIYNANMDGSKKNSIASGGGSSDVDNINWISISGTSYTMSARTISGSSTTVVQKLVYILVKNTNGNITFYPKYINSSDSEI